MKTSIALFGALREADASGTMELDVPAGSTIAELRELLVAHLAAQAPQVSADLVRRCAFATDEEILHNHREVRAGVALAVLPPVSGG
jgi:molybdopterin converting factor small subunit